MAKDIDIAGRSRRFQIAVVVTAMLLLFAAVFALASLSADAGGSTDSPNADGPNVDGPDVEGPDFDFSPDFGDGGDGGGSGPDLGDGGFGDVDFGDGDFGDVDFGDVDPSDVESAGDLAELVEELGLDELDLGDGEPGEGDQPNLSDVETPPPPYDISLEPEPTPGNTVTVTVEKSGEPVPGAVVEFNGDPVGVTLLEGQTRARVPYVTRLNVTARPATEQDIQAVSAAPPVAPNGLAAPRHRSRPGPAIIGDEHENSTATFDVQTTVSADSEYVAMPSGEIPVNFTVAGEPLPGVGAAIDGDFIGVTDAEGQLSVPVPESLDPGDQFTVTLARGDFSGTATIPIGELALSVDTGLVPLPGTEGVVSVFVTDGESEQPIPNASVTVRADGRAIADLRTAEDGTAAFTLPWSNEVTATTAVEDMRADGSASGMLLAGLVAISAGVAVLALAATWLYRNPEYVRRARNRFVAMLRTAGRLLRRLGARVYVLGARVRNRLAAVLASVRDGLSLGLLAAPLLWFYRRLRNSIVRIIAFVRSFFGDDSSEAPTSSTENASARRDQTGTDWRQAPNSAYARLLQFWRWLVRRVLGRENAPTTTAVEVEERAIQQGMPSKAVKKLRRAFQDVEYGYGEPDERIDEAETAVESIEHEEDEP